MDPKELSWKRLIEFPEYMSSKENIDHHKFFENMCYKNLYQDFGVNKPSCKSKFPEMRILREISNDSYQFSEETTLEE